jgi:hypothetical protein
MREIEEILKLQVEAAHYYARAGKAVGPTARVAAVQLAESARLEAEAHIRTSDRCGDKFSDDQKGQS